jgi:hypothetical protein
MIARLVSFARDVLFALARLVWDTVFGKKSVEAGDHLRSPSYLRESPPPDLVSQSRSYFLAHITGTVWLTRAS